MIDHRHEGKRSAPCERCGKPASRHRAARERQARPEHAPQGDPCERCGLPASRHRAGRTRPMHAPQGDPCKRCNLPASAHRAAPNRVTKRKSGKSREVKARVIVGVDGEGYDTPDGRHVYSYLAAVDEHGRVLAEAREKKKGEGLTHAECIETLLRIPPRSLVFGFSFGYDVTKILEGLPASVVYKILRPDLRKERRCKVCRHRWTMLTTRECPKCKRSEYRETTPHVAHGAYGYNWGPFAVARHGWVKRRAHRQETDEHGERWTAIRWGWRRSVRVWDAFKFFQTSFVEALSRWEVGTREQRERILRMKNQRGAFARVERDAIESYCREECHMLAMLMRRMLDAHGEAGLRLRRYDGPGSTASALLAAHNVTAYAGPRLTEMPRELQSAVMGAYFGGRFENSVIGRVDRAIQGADINAAYPYALTFMPCLECGTWRKVTRDVRRHVEAATAAVCRFRVGALSEEQRRALAWGPLPCRAPNGSLVFGTNFSGWAWWQELAPALRGWPDLVELGAEAWVYTTRCKHKPFAFMPANYRERCEWGATGRGIVRKLGDNSCYGKLAQSAGERPKYQNWIWAGMCTATTRGQLLEVIASARDPWDVLSVATDGVTMLRPMKLPAPRDTGTNDCTSKGKPKVFGAWDAKRIDGGALYVKPGMLLPLDPASDELRARGIGRRELAKHRVVLQNAWDTWDRADYSEGARVPIVSRRFLGAKVSIVANYRCLACGGRWPGVIEQGCRTPSCERFGKPGTKQRVHYRRVPPCSPECWKRYRQAWLADREPKGCGRVVKRRVVNPADPSDVEIARMKCLAPLYGTWAPHDVLIAFDPAPKRERSVSKRGALARLHVPDLGGVECPPYVAGVTTPEGDAAREAREIAEWQHDADGGEVEELEAAQ